MENSLETTKIFTVEFRGRHIGITEQQAAQFKSDALKLWELGHRPYVTDTAIEAGRRLVRLGLVSAQGSSDPVAVETARGKILLELLLERWDRTTDTGAPLPINAATIGGLPRDVVRLFGLSVEGSDMTKEELDALKLPAPKS